MQDSGRDSPKMAPAPDNFSAPNDEEFQVFENAKIAPAPLGDDMSTQNTGRESAKVAPAPHDFTESNTNSKALSPKFSKTLPGPPQKKNWRVGQRWIKVQALVEFLKVRKGYMQ